ncbi:hypothetical protein [Luteolibacter soli]|uniref:Uncharacterized protein n=1 Tax=Luteolibacter soli TaxID=3135280 RepID=A0ABU9AZ35_9BACT
MKPSFLSRFGLVLITGVLTWAPSLATALSLLLSDPEIRFPENYDADRAAKINVALRNPQDCKYLGGLTSHWEPEWATRLVYEGDEAALEHLLTELHRIDGLPIRLTASPDLSNETGSALQAGSWWVTYSHTAPDTLTVRVNLAATSWGEDGFQLQLPKPEPSEEAASPIQK